jgi:glutamate-5-semialdehyde dehydrogenase
MSQAAVHAAAQRAREASFVLATATRADKDRALAAMARSLDDCEQSILDANARDVDEQEAAGLSTAMVDRLRLSPERVAAMAAG